jgi:hypothetical protein
MTASASEDKQNKDQSANRPSGAIPCDLKLEAKPIQKQKQILEAVLLPHGKQVVDVDADGNCQFAAVAAQLNLLGANDGGAVWTAGAVRARVATHMRGKKEEWEPFIFENEGANWEKFSSRIAQDKEWGNHLTLLGNACSSSCVCINVVC